MTNVPLARRTIVADRRRLTASVMGVAAVIAMMLLLEGLRAGAQVQVSTYEDHVGADLFVGERGTRNFLGVPSVLPRRTVREIRAIAGVDDAAAVIARFAVLDLHGTKQFTFVIGSVPGSFGGPWGLSAGREVEGDDEVVLDATVADQHGLGLGDRLFVMGTPFRIVGLSDETRSWMAGFVFATHAAVERLLSTSGTTSFVLVRTAAPGPVAAEIADRLRVSVMAPTVLGDHDRALLADVMNGPISLMLSISVLAGALIVALSVYSSVVERTREYGIVKAMGARPSRVVRLVLGQTVIMAVLGAAAGALLFLGVARIVTTVRPEMWIRVTWSIVATTGASALVIAVLAALVPTRRVNRLDPASVYRG